MRTQTAVMFVACWLVVSTPSSVAFTQMPDRPAVKALRFFEAMRTRDVGEVLRRLRPQPIGAEQRARVLAALPKRGALPLNWYERPKLAMLEPVLAYHERAGIFETKVFDAPEAIVALHERTVLLFSRQTLRLLSGAELQAMVAHEIGHDYFWAEFERAFARNDHRGRQELELKCDGIALLTLMALNLDPASLVNGLREVTRFNEMLKTDGNVSDYPTLQERHQFIKALRDLADPNAINR